MDVIHESSDQIEFANHFSLAARALILTGGLLALMAPYELLFKPVWRGGFSLIWWFCVLISAGAAAITLFAICAALFGLSQRIQFDSESQVITYGFKATLLRYREKRYPFDAVETLDLKTHEWSEGPATYNLALKLTGADEIEFGRFTERAEAERYLAALERMVKHGGNEN